MPIGLTRRENGIALALADPGGDPLADLCAGTLDITQRPVLALGAIDPMTRLGRLLDRRLSAMAVAMRFGVGLAGAGCGQGDKMQDSA
ncbi:hypothetical protein LMG29660_03373 [Burkholderia puraquae]|nr:hypothetical protein LMG29660_03373 [Burkholderia puraquae]